MNWLQSFFSTPARQALGWTTLGILGILMAAGGVWFLSDDGGGPGQVAQADDSTAQATSTATTAPSATATRTASPTPSATPTPTQTPIPAATARPAVTNPGTGGGAPASDGSQQEAEAPATATPEPTEPPVVAGGAYCPPATTQTLPSGRVAGAVTISGSGAAPGAVDLFVAFDGVIGPSAKNVDGAFRIDFWAAGSDCANRVGSSISVYANGQYFATGRAVGDGGGQLIPVTVALP